MNGLLQWVYSQRKLVLWLIPVFLLAPPVYWVASRTIPFQVFMDRYTPPTGRAGEEVLFVVPMKRDLSQRCSLVASRILVDSTGATHNYIDRTETSPDGIRLRQKINPEALHTKILIPPNFPSGPSHVISDIAYSCLGNPTTIVWPMRMVLDWPFEMLPPDPKKVIVVPIPIVP